VENFYYPSEELPLWVVFKYELEIPQETPEVKVKIDLTKMFHAQAKK
jgi:hypothetical protein